jgi:hypothetical protein
MQLEESKKQTTLLERISSQLGSLDFGSSGIGFDFTPSQTLG